MAGESTSSLYFLGRRIERLLYVGLLLLVLCFTDVYLVSAYTYVSSLTSTLFGKIADEVQAQSTKLTALYEKTTVSTEAAAAERPEVTATRKALGLPLQAPKPPPVKDLSAYKTALAYIIIDVAVPAHVEYTDLEKVIDETAPPDEIVKTLRVRQSAEEAHPITVFGIQAPRALTVNYTGTNYQLSLTFLSVALSIALVPLIAGWLGSLYMTRQRELIAIAGLEDYRRAFPHILNMLPVAFIHIEAELSKAKTRKVRNAERRFNRGLLMLFRIVVILVFAGPMIGGLAYSMFDLILSQSDPSLPQGLIALFVCFFLFGQGVVLMLQEWLLMRRKQFYA